jgi:hypothetical protein
MQSLMHTKLEKKLDETFEDIDPMLRFPNKQQFHRIFM